MYGIRVQLGDSRNTFTIWVCNARMIAAYCKLIQELPPSGMKMLGAMTVQPSSLPDAGVGTCMVHVVSSKLSSVNISSNAARMSVARW